MFSILQVFRKIILRAQSCHMGWNGLKHFPLSRRVQYYFWVLSAFEGYVSSSPGQELTERRAQPLCLVQPGYLQVGLVPQAERVQSCWIRMDEPTHPEGRAMRFFHCVLLLFTIKSPTKKVTPTRTNLLG